MRLASTITLRLRSRQLLASAFLLFLLLSLYHLRSFLHATWSLLAVPLTWSRGSSEFLISQEADRFDLTFRDYSNLATTSGPEYADRVPAIIHHVALGSEPLKPEWKEARQKCLDLHPGWETHLWTDANAGEFVERNFPELKDMWDGYRYPIQKVDSLRYMVLYMYGGLVLDMDLACKRALGPLRRFDFVAPAANPVGFSNGFMMASRANNFTRDIIASLKTYNRHWFGLPYPTVMFSTGCHFASTIHSLQRNRTDLKILAGPEGTPNLHRLSGAVSTPLFDHLGSSSWHSFDAALLVRLAHLGRFRIALFATAVLCALVFVAKRYFKERGTTIPRYQSNKGDGNIDWV